MAFPHKIVSYSAVATASKHETPHDVIQTILQKAALVGLKFERLDYLDTLVMGSTTFIRFRADTLDQWKVLNPLYSEGRSVIGYGQHPDKSMGFVIKLAGGRMGKTNFTTMQAEPKALRTYLGTQNDHWARQFKTPA